jgi:hypothetical protein
MMNEKKAPRQSRATTYFKFYSEKYLWGSTRSELKPDERSVWLDFLCLASFQFGRVEVFSRDHLAQQLCLSRELLDRSIEKFIKYKKIQRKYLKSKNSEVFTLANWDRYQADYLKKRIIKSTTYSQKKRIANMGQTDAENPPKEEEKRGEEMKEENKERRPIRINQISRLKNQSSPKNSPDLNQSLTPSNSTPLKRDIENIKNLFLNLLKTTGSYPFDEDLDADLFNRSTEAFPSISILQELRKKIAWWSEHPGALKSKDPREQLFEWFEKEAQYQKGMGGIKSMKEEADNELESLEYKRFVKDLRLSMED